MLQNFIAKVIHATVKLKTKLLIVEDKAFIKTLDAEKLVDNGKVYGKSSDIRQLIVEPLLEDGEDPTLGKNCSYEGMIAKPARADHTHKIPGRGTANAFGHVKLCDDTDKDYDQTSGYAATPKALQELSQKFLKLDGSSLMTGTIRAKGNPSGTPISELVPGIQFGANSYITDFGIPNTMAIAGRQNPNVASIALGLDKSTILLSKQTGHLYVRNDSQAMRDKGFTIDGERMLVDYVVEQFIIPKSDTTSDSGEKYHWTPARSGWYRLYVIGPGGKGADGFAKGSKSYIGPCKIPDKKNTVASYESPKYPTGFAIAGCGGGGGGVAVMDIYVPTAPYSYISKKNGTVKYTYVDDDGVEHETTEQTYIETPVLKQVNIKINKNARLIRVSNVFAATGTTRKIEADFDDLSEEVVEDIEDLIGEESPIQAFGGFDAEKGKAVKVATYDRKNGLKNTTSAEGKAWAASLIGQPITSQWYGMPVKTNCSCKLNGKTMTLKTGYYFLRQGMKWSGTAGVNRVPSGSGAEMPWICYDQNGREVKYDSPNAKDTISIKEGATNKIVGTFKYFIASFTVTGGENIDKESPFYEVNSKGVHKPYTDLNYAKLEHVGPTFEVGRHIGYPLVARNNYSNFDGTTTPLYEYWDVTYSQPGLGGHAEGGDVMYMGGAGDNPDNSSKLKRTGQGVPISRAVDTKFDKMDWDINAPGSMTVSHEGTSIPGWLTCADGCCGGVPGELGITGNYGANGGAGDIATLPAYEAKYDSTSSKVVSKKIGTAFARSGYGSGMCIAELGNYTGDGIPNKLTKGTAGPGKYGGGGGGGCAIVTQGNGHTAATRVQKGAVGGNGCILIAFFGDSKPKEQTNTSGIAPSLDSNKDGVDDYMQVKLTYTKSSDGSVAELEYDPYKTYVTLYDEEKRPYEGGTGKITDAQRPTKVTPAKGFKKTVIYEPSTTEIDANFSGNITVRFEKDSKMWFNVTFSVDGTGGTLVGQTDWYDILKDTPFTNRDGIEIPEPDEPEGGEENTGDGTETQGDVTPLAETEEFSIVVPTPVPDEGFEFEKWTYKKVGGIATKNGIPETVTQSSIIMAHFKAVETEA